MRINSAVKTAGADTADVSTSVLVLHADSPCGGVKEVFSSSLTWALFRAYRKLNDRNVRRHRLWGKFYEPRVGLPLSELEQIRQADVVNLHWVNDGMLTPKELLKFSRQGKVIFQTMHDMYSFTAGCYYDGGCAGYELGCVDCPMARGDAGTRAFIRKRFESKLQAFSEIDVTFVGCSSWISECARKSPICRGKNILTIPNPIDGEVFKPRDRWLAADRFGIHTDKKVLLFCADTANTEILYSRKGCGYLREATALLDPDKYMLVIFGCGGQIEDFPIEAVSVGRICSDYDLSLLYSLADVFVAPSVQENLSNTVMESLACGTPVAAFDIGGMRDMINHRQNGFIAERLDAASLAGGIEEIVSNIHKYSQNAASSAASNFSMARVGEMYVGSYKSAFVSSDDR